MESKGLKRPKTSKSLMNGHKRQKFRIKKSVHKSLESKHKAEILIKPSQNTSINARKQFRCSIIAQHDEIYKYIFIKL